MERPVDAEHPLTEADCGKKVRLRGGGVLKFPIYFGDHSVYPVLGYEDNGERIYWAIDGRYYAGSTEHRPQDIIAVLEPDHIPDAGKKVDGGEVRPATNEEIAQQRESFGKSATVRGDRQCVACAPSSATVTIKEVPDGGCDKCEVTERHRKLAEEIIYEECIVAMHSTGAIDQEALAEFLARHESSQSDPIQRLQFPDGSVPEDIAECARGWKAAYDRQSERIAELEAENAKLRECLTQEPDEAFVSVLNYLEYLAGNDRSAIDPIAVRCWAKANLPRIRAAITPKPTEPAADAAPVESSEMLKRVWDAAGKTYEQACALRDKERAGSLVSEIDIGLEYSDAQSTELRPMVINFFRDGVK